MLLYIQQHLTATNIYADYLRLSSQKMSTIKTAEAVEKQARAMSASAFEVGLFDPPRMERCPARMGPRHVASPVLLCQNFLANINPLMASTALRLSTTRASGHRMLNRGICPASS
jgi:hypothetical protein